MKLQIKNNWEWDLLGDLFSGNYLLQIIEINIDFNIVRFTSLLFLWLE